MKVQITKAFRWARDGIYVEDVHVGDVVDGRPAEIALAEGWGVEFGPAPAAPAVAVAPDARAPAVDGWSAAAPPAAVSAPRPDDARSVHRRRRGA